MALERRLVIYGAESRSGHDLDAMLRARGFRVYLVEREVDLADILKFSHPDAALLVGPHDMASTNRLIAASQNHGSLIVVCWPGITPSAATWLLDAGADYVVSSVHPDWLAAQLRAFLRRFGSDRAASSLIRLGQLCIDLHQRRVTVGDREVALTRTEFSVLRVLAERPGTVLPSGEIMQQVMGVRIPDSEAQDLLKVHVHRLRQKLEPEAEKPRFIRTVRGHGYMYAFERRSPERSPLPADDES